VDLPRHDRRINKDSRADDAAHHDHGDVEDTESARESRFVFTRIQGASRTDYGGIFKTML
jgi:hypothetical protein